MKIYTLTRLSLLGMLLFSIGLSSLGLAKDVCRPKGAAFFEAGLRRSSSQRLQVTCKGEGPTMELASLASKDACDEMAAHEFFSEISVIDQVISQDHTVATHKIVAVKSCVTDLRCDDLNALACEYAGTHVVFRSCSYDMSQVKAGSTMECLKKLEVQANSNETDVAHNSTIGRRISTATPMYQKTTSYSLQLVVTPKCDSILITGGRPRKVECQGNPTSVTINEGDHELVVRSKGFLPHTIKLDRMESDKVMNIYLNEQD